MRWDARLEILCIIHSERGGQLLVETMKLLLEFEYRSWVNIGNALAVYSIIALVDNLTTHQLGVLGG